MLEVITFLLEVIEADEVVEALADASEELQLLRELLRVQGIEGARIRSGTEPRAC